MKIGKFFIAFFLVIAIGLIILSMAAYTITDGEFAIVEQFGEVIEIVDEPGLHFKAPFVQGVRFLSKKELIHDLPISEVITKDKQTMVADCFALWRITDPKAFITNLNGSMENAKDRIEVSVYNSLKSQISLRTQAEVIGDRNGKLANDITTMSKPNFPQYGIELIAVETKHLDLPFENKQSVYDRMISERNNISTAYAADGEKDADMIRSETDKQVTIKIAEANATAEQLKAEGEAEYMKILSEAYNDQGKAEFYQFVRSLDAAKVSLKNNDNVIILNEDSPLAKIFYSHGMVPANP